MIPVLFADAGLPALGPPDWSNSSPAAVVAFGLGLTAFVIAGGWWFIRHPLPAIGTAIALPGAILAAVGIGAVFTSGNIAGLACVGMGAVMLVPGALLAWKKAPFQGRCLLLFLIGTGGLVVSAVGLSNVKWVDVRAEQRERARRALTPPAVPPTTKGQPDPH